MLLARAQWAPSIEAELKLWGVALADTVPNRADAAYLFGNTPDNELSVLQKGVQLMRPERVRGLYLCGGKPYRAALDSPIAYAGFEVWKSWLVTHGVYEGYIHEIPRLAPIWHTGTEARELVRFADKNSWSKVFIAAPWFHMPRAFVNTVSQIVQQDVRMRVFCTPGPSQPFFENALHSQGHVTNRRINLVNGERDRMNRLYGNELDLVTYAEVMSYLRWRDT